MQGLSPGFPHTHFTPCASVVGARKEIAAGALGIVHDTVSAFPSMSAEGRERMITNLLATLTSHSPTITTVAV